MPTREGFKTVEEILGNYGERLRSLETHNHDVESTNTTTFIGAGGSGDCVMVAASNAPDFIKADAAFVCDGTRDDIEINAALGLFDPIGSVFGKVCLSPGDFFFTSGSFPVNLSKPGLTLQGAGRSGVSSGATRFRVASVDSGYIIRVTAPHVSIRDFTLVSNQVGGAHKGILVDAGGDYVSIEGVEFLPNIHVGLHLSSSTAARVQNCWFLDCGKAGAGGSIDMNNPTYPLIDHCWFLNSTNTGTPFGVNLLSSFGQLDHCQFQGIPAIAVPLGGSNNKISDCIFVDCGRKTHNTYDVINANPAFGTTGPHKISDCLVRTSHANKHRYVVNAGTSTDVLISDNDFRAPTHGTACINSSGSTIDRDNDC